MEVEHEFETTEGDELSVTDLYNATWRVTETFVDVGVLTHNVVFTHRVEIHHLDSLTLGE